MLELLLRELLELDELLVELELSILDDEEVERDDFELDDVDRDD